jgi:hypothetical protein
VNPKTKSRSGVIALALTAALIVHAAPASARVDVGISLGVPAIVAPPPVVYVAPPPVVVPPPVIYGPGPVVIVGGGYWWYDRHSHRRWRRR